MCSSRGSTAPRCDSHDREAEVQRSPARNRSVRCASARNRCRELASCATFARTQASSTIYRGCASKPAAGSSIELSLCPTAASSHPHGFGVVEAEVALRYDSSDPLVLRKGVYSQVEGPEH